MQTSAELKNLLQRIDHKGYPAYKDTRGSYEFPGYVLSIDHVQGDPFAAPSKVSIHVRGKQAGFPGIMMVLSGMSNMEQMQDNVSFMRDFKPLDETERAAVEKVQEIFHSKDLIPCTACRYCTDGCPKHISIPDLFAIMNAKQIHHDWNADCYYEDVHTAPGRKASDCLKCGKCEKVCPQHLPIRKLLEQVAAEFEKAPAAN